MKPSRVMSYGTWTPGDRRLYIRAEKSEFRFGVSILIMERQPDGKLAVAEPLTMTTHDEGTVIEPTVEIKDATAQLLMDDLWRAGLRPSEGTGSAGSLRATEKHLEDMRALAFDKLKVDKP